MIGINHRDHRNAQLAGLGHGDILMTGIDHEHCVRQRIHVLDAAQALLQTVAFARQLEHFLLDQALEAAVAVHRLEFLEPIDRLADGAEVGQHAAEPAVRDVRHPATCGFFGNRLAGGALGADKQYRATLARHAADEIQRILEQRQGLFEIDDVDLAPGAEDVGFHLRVPVAGLVTKMYAGFKHLAHGDFRHRDVLL